MLASGVLKSDTRPLLTLHSHTTSTLTCMLALEKREGPERAKTILEPASRCPLEVAHPSKEKGALPATLFLVTYH